MPVKNVKRKTNDGFEGVITGLNDKEKEIISNSIGGGSDEIIEANGTFMIVEEETGTIINTLSFDNDTAQKIKEGKIKVICGYLQNFEADNDPDYFYCTLNRIQDAQTNYPTCYYRQEGNDLDKEIFTYAISISFSDEESSCTAMLAKLKNGNLTPSLPSDASSKNYTLEANNGTIAWTESSGALNIVANPIDVATNTLTKLKVDDTTYSVMKISLKRFRITKENLSHSSGSSVISYSASAQQDVTNFLTNIDTITEKGQYILSCRIVVSLTNAPLPIVLSGEWSNENPVGSRGIYANTYSKSGGIVSYFGLDDGIQASNAEYFDVLFNNISYIEYQVTYAIPVIEG